MTTLEPIIRSATEPIPAPRDQAMLAHDVRSALNGVMGGAASLARQDLPPAVREQVDRIAAASHTLSCLVATMLGQDHVETAADAAGGTDLRRLIDHLDRRWAGEAESQGLRLVVRASGDLPFRIAVDFVSLVRAVGNLMGNALRYGRSGEVRLEILRTVEAGVEFVVRDQGPGIPAETIDKVMRQDQGNAVFGDGHGLGLHIVRKLSAEMGLAFTLENGPEGGLVARLTLPARLCEVAPMTERGGARRADLRGVRVLLAEDNPINQMVATQMLRALEAEVTLATDGVEALERFDAAAFDMIVVDIEMPRMSGLDVIRTIRGRRDGRAAVPIVALTAYAMREHRDRIAAAGANGLISKPITSVEALGEALRAHLAPDERSAALVVEAIADVEAPVADLVVFDALCAAIGQGMMAELLEKVVADLMQARADLAGALSPLDRKPIRSASHILISVAGAVGATRLQACARALNAAAHGEDAGSLPADVRRCLEEIDAAVAFADSRRPGG